MSKILETVNNKEYLINETFYFGKQILRRNIKNSFTDLICSASTSAATGIDIFIYERN